MDSPAVPSKRPRLSVEVEPSVSWTQDEWSDFLVNECQTTEDRARQIAAQLVEQDFGTGRFESVISEWQLNAKGCKEILLGIGFKQMDIFPFITALRRHIEKEKATNEKTQTTTHLANLKRPMCNELVWAVCKGIGVVKTSDRILLTSASIYAYLEKAFRKKLIYRGAISFIKANNWSKFSIKIIEQKDQNIEDELVVINQKQTESEYELWTSHLHIHLESGDWSVLHYGPYIGPNGLKNGHMQFFVQLIAPHLRPLVVDVIRLDDCNSPIGAHFLRKIQDSIDWVQISDEQLSLEPISAVLSNCNKLDIYNLTNLDENQIRQFCDALIRWINTRNGGQPKIKQPFVMRLFVKAAAEEPPLAEFTLSNARTREQLQLRHRDERRYLLMRHHITETLLEWKFGNEMTSIKLALLKYSL